MLGDDLEAWMADSSMLRRTFRNVAVIAGLIERHHPGAEKNAAPGDGEHRPDLRRAAPPPARPHPAARHPGRRGGRADRPRADRGDAGARPRARAAHGAVARLAAGGAGAAGDRPGERARRAAATTRCWRRRNWWPRRWARPSRRRSARAASRQCNKPARAAGAGWRLRAACSDESRARPHPARCARPVDLLRSSTPQAGADGEGWAGESA